MKASGEKQEGTRHVWRTTENKKTSEKVFPSFPLECCDRIKNSHVNLTSTIN